MEQKIPERCLPDMSTIGNKPDPAGLFTPAPSDGHLLYAAIKQTQVAESRRLPAEFQANAASSGQESTAGLEASVTENVEQAMTQILALRSSSQLQECMQERGIEYVEQAELEDLMKAAPAGTRSVIVADTREDDRVGGHITGSEHTPSCCFEQVRKALTRRGVQATSALHPPSAPAHPCPATAFYLCSMSCG
jgi:hypothetical protein